MITACLPVTRKPRTIRPRAKAVALATATRRSKVLENVRLMRSAIILERKFCEEERKVAGTSAIYGDCRC